MRASLNPRSEEDAGVDPIAARAAVVGLRDAVANDAEAVMQAWGGAIADPSFEDSARNLAQYLALRRRDVSALQPMLAELGLSSLGRCEGHVMANLDAVAAALAAICGLPPEPFPNKARWNEGPRRLTEQCALLFGANVRSTAIMVTLPSEAALEPELALKLVEAGMDCARINCAHDAAEAWAAMALNVRKAAADFGRECRIVMDLPGPKCRIEALSPERPVRLRRRERFRLLGEPGRECAPDVPALAISFPQVVRRLPLGAPVWIDDGKIRGRVVEIEGDDRIVAAESVPAKGGKLRVEKGVNFPGFPLDLPSLSPEDLAALPSVAAHADLIGFSFVQHAKDIDALDSALQSAGQGGPPKPLILKIETPEAVRNLPRLIVRAAGARPTAVMIARGDLAVELGHQRLAEMQEEILWLCEAARVPAIWATQVLDDLVKEGLPSRAETTDAAMSQRAECVMLNKGPHVVEAIRFLSDMVGRMDRHQIKKSPRLGELHSWPLETLTNL